MSERELTVRAKAWSWRRGVCLCRVLVREDAVLVWDALAGHYTRCHALSERAQARIRKLARA